ncbi:hypothetical protein H0H87_008669 [Tephrocybe sp. NHM501043]|nr:hypothetical protein H0H87_008669 [Tephrocybe sp. NHM501043]
MFARFSAAILLALPLLAAAGCSTEKQQCCNSVQKAGSPSAASLLSLLGVAVQGVTAQVGLTCSPLTALGAAGQSCNQQTVCCENNNFNGIVALGCTPINLNA